MAKRFVAVTTDWCCLCGYPIPVNIVSPDHPLFGTVEHLVPRSKGGSNKLFNRRAAHKFCNALKGPRLLSEVDAKDFRDEIKPLMEKAGFLCGKGMQAKARARIASDRHLQEQVA